MKNAAFFDSLKQGNNEKKKENQWMLVVILSNLIKKTQYCSKWHLLAIILFKE